MNKELLFQVWKIKQDGNYYVGTPFDLRSISGPGDEAPAVVEEGGGPEQDGAEEEVSSVVHEEAGGSGGQTAPTGPHPAPHPASTPADGRPPAGPAGGLAAAADRPRPHPAPDASPGQHPAPHPPDGAGGPAGGLASAAARAAHSAQGKLARRAGNKTPATKKNQKQRSPPAIASHLEPSSSKTKNTAEKIRSFLKSWIKTINKYYQKAYPKFKLIKKHGKSLKGLITLGSQIVKFNDITKFIMYLVTANQSFIPKSLQTKIKQLLGSVITFCDKVHNSKDFKRIRKELNI